MNNRYFYLKFGISAKLKAKFLKAFNLTFYQKIICCISLSCRELIVSQCHSKSNNRNEFGSHIQ